MHDHNFTRSLPKPNFLQCRVPGSSWALEQAKRNLVNSYFLVGLTEELQDFVEILEVSYPRIFKGATAKFLTGMLLLLRTVEQHFELFLFCPRDVLLPGKKAHLRKTFNKLDPSEETIRKFKKSQIWQMENEFYQFAAQQFQFVKKRTLVLQQNSGQATELGQQFFYEKIRPK